MLPEAGFSTKIGFIAKSYFSLLEKLGAEASGCKSCEANVNSIYRRKLATATPLGFLFEPWSYKYSATIEYDIKITVGCNSWQFFNALRSGKAWISHHLD